MRISSSRLISTAVLVLSVTAVVMLQQGNTEAAAGSGWSVQFGTADHDGISALALDGAGGVAAVGWTDGVLGPDTPSASGRHAFVRTYDSSGAELWTSEFGDPGSTASQAVFDHSGNLFVAGQADGTLTGQSKGGMLTLVRKYDSLGRAEWTQQFGIAGRTGIGRLATDSEGNVYAAGWVDGTLAGQVAAGQYDAFAVKFDAAGRTVWVSQFGTEAQDRAIGLSIGPDRTVSVGYLTGDSESDLTANIRQFDSDGQVSRTFALPLAPHEAVLSMVADTTNSIYIAGSQQHTAGQGFLRKYDATGKVLWSEPVKKLDTTSTDAVDVVVDVDDTVYVVGRTRADPSKKDVALLRSFTPDGKSHKVNDTQLGGAGAATSVAASGNQIVIAGWTNGSLKGSKSAGRSDAFIVQVAP